MSSGRLTKLLFPLNGYRPVEADYLETEPGVGKMEIKGRRPGQEDAMKVQKLAGFAQLSAEQQDAALKNTFLKMQQAHGNHAMQGSTAISATAYIDSNNKLHATVASLGDSEAYIVTIDTNGKTDARRLNIKLHNVKDNKSEHDRILATGRMVSHDRVEASLAVSRAIGDTNVLNHESDHQPEIDRYQVQLEPGQTAYLVVGCDGLYESRYGAQSNKQKIEMVNNAMSNHHADLGAAANKLVATAFNENFSEDNISAAVVAVTPGDAVSIGLFDGHGGAVVSKALGEHFFPELEKNISTPELLMDDPIPVAPTTSSIASDAVVQTRVISDFDGTLTGIGGQEVFNTQLNNGKYFAQFLIENKYHQELIDQVAKELMDKNDIYRIQPKAREFLIEMAKRSDIDLVIVSRNYKSYIIAAMRYEKIPEELIDVLKNKIHDRESFDSKADVTGVLPKSEIRTTYVLDDFEADRGDMVYSLKNQGEISAPQHGTGQFDWQEITKQVLLSADKNAQLDPIEIVVEAKTKKEFLAELIEKLNARNHSQDQILRLFEELKKRDGKYKFIHEQSHSTFDSFRLLFKSNKNAGESYFWHTDTYQAAVKYLKIAYLDRQKRDNVSPDKETTRGWDLINYTRGNAVMHREHTSAHEEREQIGKPGKK